MNSDSTNLNIRVDKKVKKEADILFKDLGINTSVAINMFLRQCIREQSIPFIPSLELPNKRLEEAIEQSEFYINDPDYPSYNNMEDFKKSLDD